MSDIFRFPKGYDVKILRKEDVLASIDANIIDKDVALEIVKRCEVDAANFIREGRWAGIPFVGAIRIPKTKLALISDKTKELLDEAKQTLEHDKYLLFRHTIASDIGRQVKIERYYKYIVSKFVGKNSKLFKKLSIKHGDSYARLICYTLSDVSPSGMNNYE